MADCSGNWIDSTIHWTKKDGEFHDPPLTLDDGEFEIDPHPGSSVFTGRHTDAGHNQTVLFKTKCTDLSPNRFAIRIMRLDLTKNPPEIFEYRGEGVIINPVTSEAIITGRVFVHGPPDPGDTGTWETSRPGGGDDDDDDDEAENENEDNDGDVSNKRAR